MGDMSELMLGISASDLFARDLNHAIKGEPLEEDPDNPTYMDVLDPIKAYTTKVMLEPISKAYATDNKVNVNTSATNNKPKKENKKMEFRKLRADEIDARVATINEKGLTLLLYKDARVDQNILDETIGCLNWQRSHQLIGDRLYCTVSIWDEGKKQWISKQDVGTESYTEKEKGQASDSFKRACFNLGIGRELYTAPFIWIPSDKYTVSNKNGKPTTYDKFVVSDIDYTDGVITKLEIKNKGEVVYSMGVPKTTTNTSNKKATPKQIEILLGVYKDDNLTKLLKANNIKKIEDLPMTKASELISKLKK